MSNWIQTYSGKKFDPFDIDINSIDIIDIAHALSNQCRYTGHTKFFYSVAQHSYYVSQICEKPDALYGLLHDASEAYITDIASPIKAHHIFKGYYDLEHYIQQTIYAKFGLHNPEPESVRFADRAILHDEAYQLMWPLQPEWDHWLKGILSPHITIQYMLPKNAETLFLARFKELTNV